MRKTYLNNKTTGNLLKGIFYRKKKFPKSTDDQTLSTIPSMMRHKNKSDN